MKLRGSYLRNYKNYFHSRRYYFHIRAVFVNHERVLHSRERLFVPTSSHGGTLNLTRLKRNDSSFATSYVPPPISLSLRHTYHPNQAQSLTATSESRDYELRETISTRRTRVITTQTKGTSAEVITQVQQYMKPGLQLQTDRPTQSSQKREEKLENCTRINVSNNFERKI